MQRVVTLLAAVLLLSGAAMLIQAANTPRFKDPAAFRQQVDAMSAEHRAAWEAQSTRFPARSETSSGDLNAFHKTMRAFEAELSKRYWPMLDAHQSNKYRLQDHGGTVILAGILLLLIGRYGHAVLRTPPRRWMLQAAMFVPPLLAIPALAVDFHQVLGRDEYPPWADLIVTPILMAGMFFVPGALIWMGAHQLLVPEVYYRSQPLALAFTWRINPWLGLLALLAAAMTAVNLWYGQWWWTIASLSWLYIYLAMAATRRAPYLYADLEPEWPPAWNTR